GEIETALLTQASVGHAVVIARHDRHLGDHLVAYLVPKADSHVDTETVLASIKPLLPAYMMPAALVVLDRLPLTASGKINRRALPAPVYETTEFRAPTTALEQTVAEAFIDVLGVERVGLDDNFFDLGGHSLIAVALIARINNQLGCRLSLRDV